MDIFKKLENLFKLKDSLKKLKTSQGSLETLSTLSQEYFKFYQEEKAPAKPFVADIFKGAKIDASNIDAIISISSELKEHFAPEQFALLQEIKSTIEDAAAQAQITNHKEISFSYREELEMQKLIKKSESATKKEAAAAKEDAKLFNPKKDAPLLKEALIKILEGRKGKPEAEFFVENKDKAQKLAYITEGTKESLRIKYRNTEVKFMLAILKKGKDQESNIMTIGNISDKKTVELLNKARKYLIEQSGPKELDLNPKQTTAKTTTKQSKLSVEDYTKSLKIADLNLNQAQVEFIAKALDAYNKYNALDDSRAQNVLDLLTKKVTADNQTEQSTKSQDTLKNTLRNQHILVQKFITRSSSVFANKDPKTLSELVTDNKSLRALAIAIDCKENLSKAQASRLETITTDSFVWDSINKIYDKTLREAAQDTASQLRATMLLKGEASIESTLEDAFKDNSKECKKEILTRAICLAGLKEKESINIGKINSLLNKTDCAIKFQEFAVASDQQHTLSSGAITEVMRSLAEGVPVNTRQEDEKREDSTNTYLKKHYAKVKELFGQEPNFEELIASQLGKSSKKAVPTQLTPYQKRYKTLGLMTAISGKLDPKSLQEEIVAFSENDKLAKAFASSKLSTDDYLFSVYAEVILNKPIDIFDCDIKDKKETYAWESFKDANTKGAITAAQDFKKNLGDKAEKSIAQMVVTGSLGAGRPSVHHNKPLKFAIADKNPASYNNQNNLVIMMPWHACHDDKHEKEHITNVSGKEANGNGAYIVKQKDGSYCRKSHRELFAGDIICYEKIQTKDNGGNFHYLVNKNDLYISSTGAKISSPTLPQKALELEKQKD